MKNQIGRLYQKSFITLMFLGILLLFTAVFGGCARGNGGDKTDNDTVTVSEKETLTPTATETPEETIISPELETSGETTITPKEQKVPEETTATPTEKETPSVTATPTEKETPAEPTEPENGGEAVSANVQMYEGTYGDSVTYTGLPSPDVYCVIEISKVTDTSFDFAVYQVTSETGAKDLIFRQHTAIFTGDGTQAVYNGKEYTLQFTFPDNHEALPDVTDIEVSGFAPLEGHTYVNNGIPGHEFS